MRGAIKTELLSVISFDLDNTLYDNSPVIAAAEQFNQSFLAKHFKQQQQPFDISRFSKIRQQFLEDDNTAFENLTYLREQVLLRFCDKLTGRDDIVQQTLAGFIERRQRVSIEPQITKLLDELRGRYRIISVTNGNCDAKQLSIGHVFSKNYSPQDGYRSKPHPQMLVQACHDMAIEPQQLLHVGDSILSDQLAAKNANCQFHYFSPFTDEANLTSQVEQISKLLMS
jgi:FMN hydrolase / 5-amino-6-(5-phospho-D-ribitylamino)uracil phosphatase